jgi:hypothetical protein
MYSDVVFCVPRLPSSYLFISFIFQAMTTAFLSETILLLLYGSEGEQKKNKYSKNMDIKIPNIFYILIKF